MDFFDKVKTIIVIYAQKPKYENKYKEWYIELNIKDTEIWLDVFSDSNTYNGLCSTTMDFLESEPIKDIMKIISRSNLPPKCILKIGKQLAGSNIEERLDKLDNLYNQINDKLQLIVDLLDQK